MRSTVFSLRNARSGAFLRNSQLCPLSSVSLKAAAPTTIHVRTYLLQPSQIVKSPMFKIVTKSQIIESRIKLYSRYIGDDMDAYKGHIYRLLNFSHYLIENDPKISSGMTELEKETLETALVFHDIGLWTKREMDYPHYSMFFASEEIKAHQWECDEQCCLMMIKCHHHVFEYKTYDHNDSMGIHLMFLPMDRRLDVANAMRRSHWIEVSKNRLCYGIDRRYIERVNEAFPPQGYHEMMSRLDNELCQNNPLLRIYKQYQRCLIY